MTTLPLPELAIAEITHECKFSASTSLRKFLAIDSHGEAINTPIVLGRSLNDSSGQCLATIDPIYDPFSSFAFCLSGAHYNNSCHSISKLATIVDAFTMYAMATDPRLLSFPPSVFAKDTTRSGGIIIDAGFTLTILRNNIHNTMRNTFVKGMRRFPKAERGPFLIHATIFSDVATRKYWRPRFISPSIKG